MKIAYISGSYRNKSINGVFENIIKARQVAIKYWKKGYSVLCPHLNTGLMDGSCPDDTWIKGDLEFIKRLIPGIDVVVMMQDWQLSEGAVTEHHEAQKRGLEVIYE